MKLRVASLESLPNHRRSLSNEFQLLSLQSEQSRLHGTDSQAGLLMRRS